MKSSDIHVRAISQAMSQPSVTKIRLNITYIKFHSNLLSGQCVNESPIKIHKFCSDLNVLPLLCVHRNHYSDVIMGAMVSQITSLTIVYSTIYSDADQRKHQSSVSLAFVREIHRGPVNSPHKWPVMGKMFPFDDVIMISCKLGEYLNSWRPCDAHMHW